MKILKLKKNSNMYNIPKKFFGIGSFHSKYVIIGCGYSGYTLAKFLTQDPFKISGDQITIIDPVPDYTIFPLLKYHCYGQKNISDTTHKLDDILPNKIKLRHHEILELDPNENLLLGSESLRHTYEKLIIASGLEPDYSDVPGLLYSLQDNNDPIFTSYEYDTVMTKFCIYSAALINQIKYDFGKTLSMKNSEFIDNGKGNIIFSNVSLNYYDILENIQMIILLYELILKFRKKEFLDSLNFYLCLPISRDDFISHSKELNSYFVNLLEERKIKINWNHKINEVKSNNIIKFEILEENELNDRVTEIKTNSNKKCIEMEYNFAYVLPKLVLPSFIRYSPIFEGKNKIEYDTKKLNLTDKFENISVIGDALINNNFLDRFYPNIVRQAEVISSNLKASHFRLGKSYLKEYIPTKKIYFDFKMENYLLFDTSNGNHESLKKSQWNNFLFKHLYFRPEGFYAQRFLLKRKLE